MSLHLPRRRLVQSALTLHHPPNRPPHHLLCTTRKRTLFGFLRPSPRTPPLDPLAANFLKRKPTASSPMLPPPRGDLAPSSIFESSDAPPTSRSLTPTSSRSTPSVPKRDPASMVAALDPKPFARKRWQRNMLIRDIRQRYRLNKTKLLMRTERESLSKSHMFSTSVKKLGPLARQIAGKGIEDAMVQMRFSKTTGAGEVLKHLEYAKNEAIVRRGMGLGSVGETASEPTPDLEVHPSEERETAKPITIVEKSGKKRVVKSPSQIYISQAWVGRGSYGYQPDHRARGQVYSLRPPHTSITLLLKEEATRIRLADEREQKRQNKKVWVPLPDRPVTAQRQYCLW